jgi:hypothetical protein
LEDLDLLEPREELDLDSIDQGIPKGSSSESYRSEVSESEDD